MEVAAPDFIGGDDGLVSFLEELDGLADELRYGLLELDGVVVVALVCEAGAKVLPKCVFRPVSADGSGSFIGSMRMAAAWSIR